MIRHAFLLTLLSTLASLAVGLGCGDDGTSGGDGPSTGPQPGAETSHGLTREQAAAVLVKVGEETITVGEFAERLADQSPYLRARYNSPERRREFLDNMVRFELLALEAQRRGLADLPEVQRTRKQVMIQQMMKELFEDRIQLADITDEEIRTYYEAHQTEFHKPEQVRASHILFTDRASAERVLAQLKRDPTDVNLFRSLAEAHNTDAATRDRFGDLRFFSRPEEREDGEPEVPEPVALAAFAIPEIGGLHPTVVQSPAGFHVVKLTGRRAALRRTLDEARRPIQNRLWREKRETAIDEFVARLRREANVQENLDLLSEVRIDVPDGDSPTAEPPGSPIVPPPDAPAEEF